MGKSATWAEKYGKEGMGGKRFWVLLPSGGWQDHSLYSKQSWRWCAPRQKSPALAKLVDGETFPFHYWLPGLQRDCARSFLARWKHPRFVLSSPLSELESHAVLCFGCFCVCNEKVALANGSLGCHQGLTLAQVGVSLTPIVADHSPHASELDEE